MTIYKTIPSVDGMVDKWQSEGFRVWVWRGGWDGQELIVEVGLEISPTASLVNDVKGVINELECPVEITATWPDGSSERARTGNGEMDTPGGPQNVPFRLTNHMVINCGERGVPHEVAVSLVGKPLWVHRLGPSS